MRSADGNCTGRFDQPTSTGPVAVPVTYLHRAAMNDRLVWDTSSGDRSNNLFNKCSHQELSSQVIPCRQQPLNLDQRHTGQLNNPLASMIRSVNTSRLRPDKPLHCLRFDGPNTGTGTVAQGKRMASNPFQQSHCALGKV